MNVLKCEECKIRDATATGICPVCDGEMTEKEYYAEETTKMYCRDCKTEMYLYEETPSQIVFRCNACKIEAVIGYKWRLRK